LRSNSFEKIESIEVHLMMNLLINNKYPIELFHSKDIFHDSMNIKQLLLWNLSINILKAYGHPQDMKIVFFIISAKELVDMVI
jgi:hypothetical protein